MKLKKLTILGFKSFADKTEILFDEGVTCVVGPNGCGKSNISDSIRWVLGERSAKMLRGSSMEDVIFNGTEYRKPLNFAEVSLTIDNTDRTLPLDYAEVTITRRLHRSGESEYLINKTACRLKDVQDLILDTGIGTRQYSMIEQGKIDHLLRAEPEERRALIEEAAGIAKFKTKKDEALRKLQRTEDNLLRLNDIVLEVEKNIKYAERQAKKAEKYKVEFDHLRNLEIERVFLAQKQIQQKKNELLAEQSQILSAIADLEREHHRLRSEIGGLETQVTEIQNQFQIKELGRYQKVSQSEKNEQQVQFISDKKMELAQQKGELLQEQDQLQEALKQSAEKKEQILRDQQEVSVNLPGLVQQIETANARLESIDQNLVQSRQGLEQVRIQFFDRSRESSSTRNQIERNRAFLEHFAEQKQRFEADQARLRQALQANFEAIQKVESELLQFRAQAEQAHFNLENCQAAEQDTDRAVNELALDLEKKRIALGEMDAKLEILRGFQVEGEQEFLKFQNEIQQFSGLYDKLSDSLEITAGYERLFDAALKSYTHLLFLKQSNSLAQIWADMKSKGKTSESIAFVLGHSDMPAPAVPTALAQIGARPLSDFVRIDDSHRSSVGKLFGSFLVVDHLPLESLADWFPVLGAWTVISRDGMIIEPNGLVYSFQAERKSQFAASRKREMETVQQAWIVLEEQIRGLTAQLVDLENKYDSAQAAAQDALRLKSQLGFQVEQLSREQVRLGQEREKIQQQEKVSLSEFDDWARRAQEAQESQLTLSHALAGLENEERELQGQLRQRETELEAFQKDKESCLVNRREVMSSHESWKQKEIHLRDALVMIESHARLDQERLLFLDEGKNRLVERDAELRQEEQQAIQLRSVLEKELQDISVEIELIRKDKIEQETRLANYRQEIERRNSEIKSNQDRQHGLEMRIKDYDFEEKSFIERLEQKYRVAFVDVVAPAEMTHEDLAALDEKINDLQKRVDQLGTVNLLAIEEYDELKQRFDFLTGQKKDLEDSREQLLEAIRKINRTTKQLFEDTFQNVQRQFGEYYKTLFSGGEAKLILLDEAHPLDSGVDIVVRPPGKKLQHISLLSGGEKALTAVALIFALFSIKPSPFCLLDEVDAPLDEANVDRFIKVTQSFIKLSQFIIITHNRKTIAMGNSLYGVTMQEAGVSKIVSVRVASDLPDLTPTKKAPSAGTVPV